MDGLLTIEIETLPGSIDVDDQGVKLPDDEALYVVMENWHVLPTGAALDQPNATEVLFGYRGQYVHWLRPGGTTDKLYVRSLEEISLKTRPGETATIFYSYTRRKRK